MHHSSIVPCSEFAPPAFFVPATSWHEKTKKLSTHKEVLLYNKLFSTTTRTTACEIIVSDFLFFSCQLRKTNKQTLNEPSFYTECFRAGCSRLCRDGVAIPARPGKKIATGRSYRPGPARPSKIKLPARPGPAPGNAYYRPGPTLQRK